MESMPSCFKKLLKGFLLDKYLHSSFSEPHITMVTLKMLTHELLRTTQGSGWRSWSTERNRTLPNDTQLLVLHQHLNLRAPSLGSMLLATVQSCL